MSEEFLTDAEIELIRLIAQGKMNREISQILNIPVRILNNKRSSLSKKLVRFTGRKHALISDITRFAIQSGLIKVC